MKMAAVETMLIAPALSGTQAPCLPPCLCYRFLVCSPHPGITAICVTGAALLMEKNGAHAALCFFLLMLHLITEAYVIVSLI